MNKIPRRLLALVIAPLAPAVLPVAFDHSFAIVAVAFSYLVFSCVGLPVVLALRHFQWLNIASLLLSGAVLGAVSFALFLDVLFGSSPSSVTDLRALLWGAGLGMSVAGSYGAIAGIRNLSAVRPCPKTLAR